MGSLITPAFTGVSSFATDLQNIITRAVGIASLPLHQLQDQLTTLNDRSTALSGLSDKFSALQTAMQNLSGAAGPDSLSGSSSSTGMAAVHVSSGAEPNSYTLDISDPGAFSASISDATLPAVANPTTSSISNSSSFTLTVNDTPYYLTPPGTTLTDLVTSINQSGSGMHASLINTGDSATPNYRLVIRSQDLGANTVQLTDDSNTDLLGVLNTGEPAQYTIEGLPTPIQSSSRTVTIAPGVTVDLLGQTPALQPVTITVSRDASKVQSAVSAFIAAYNAAVDSLDQQIGANAGALSGNNVVYSLRKSLSQITQFTQSGTVSSLGDMGVKLDSQGKLSLNASKFGSQDLSAIQEFLGAADVSGFLQSASLVLNQVEDPLTGTLPSTAELMSNDITRQNALIMDSQRHVDDIQTSLQQQMSAADAMLAQLENQKSFFNNLFTAMINSNLNGAGVSSK